MKKFIKPIDTTEHVKRIKHVTLTLSVIYMLATSFFTYRWYVEHKGTIAELFTVRAQSHTVSVVGDQELEIEIKK